MPAALALFRTDRIGDLVLTLPAMKAVKQAFPEARVAAVVAPRTRAIADGQPFLDEVFAWEPGLGRGTLEAWLRGFDTMVCFYPRPAIAFAAWRAGVAVRIGTRYRWYSPFFNRRVPVRRRTNLRHELQYNLELLRPLGIDLADAPLVPPPEVPGAAAAATTLIAAAGLPERFALVHPGSGGSALNASPGWYGRMAAAIEAAGLAVAVTGTPVEAARAATTLAGAGLPVTRFITPPSLPVLTAVLARARVVIGPSTGPLHLAAAAGVPTVGLYPRVHAQSPVRWAPRGPAGLVLQPAMMTRLPNPMDGIAPADVVSAVARVMRA